jgi:hypothetical protein
MKTGDKVKLVKFNEKGRPKKALDDSEAYWKLIGETGTVRQDPQEKTVFAHFSKKPRVLVQFNKDVASTYGVIAHNNIENSLWVLVSDLEIISD